MYVFFLSQPFFRKFLRPSEIRLISGSVGEFIGGRDAKMDCCIFTGEERGARPFPLDGLGGVGGSTIVDAPSDVVMIRRVL